MIDVEIPIAIADEIASWRGVFAHRKNGVDARDLLRRAAADFWQVLEINKTVYPECQDLAHQEIVDALNDLAISADIPPDDAQSIFAESFRAPPQHDDQKPNGKTHGRTHKSETPPPLPFLNIAAWRGQPVPEREWTVKDRIPRNNVTLLSGEGSVGKSILSLQLAVAIVLGRDWLGTLPEPGPVLVVCCEDDADELWRRLDRIFRHYSADYDDFKNLYLVALAGQETLLAVPDRNGLIQATELFGRIPKTAIDIRPQLIVLDNAADVYGGNENDRAQVRQFIGLLRGMAMAAGAGLLLTSHPSLTGITSGTGLSGSTAWNASVRSRLYFQACAYRERRGA